MIWLTKQICQQTCQPVCQQQTPPENSRQIYCLKHLIMVSIFLPCKISKVVFFIRFMSLWGNIIWPLSNLIQKSNKVKLFSDPWWWLTSTQTYMHWSQLWNLNHHMKKTPFSHSILLSSEASCRTDPWRTALAVIKKKKFFFFLLLTIIVQNIIKLIQPIHSENNATSEVALVSNSATINGAIIFKQSQQTHGANVHFRGYPAPKRALDIFSYHLQLCFRLSWLYLQQSIGRSYHLDFGQVSFSIEI